jgi:uncharacterized protein YkwD
MDRRRFASLVLGLLTVPGAARARAGISRHEIVRLANAARGRRRPLVADDRLMEAAERKLDHMIENDYFAHTHGKRTPWSFMREAGYEPTAAAENLGRGYDSAREAHDAWMKSRGHRRNILGDFEDIGVAAKDDLVVVMFGKR